MSGILISFEGIDGCGKTTQVKLLQKYLATYNQKCILVKEFSGQALSDLIKSIENFHLQNNCNDYYENNADDPQILEKKFSEIGFMYLIMSARQKSLFNITLPNLAKGNVVIYDRFIDSTAVYQSNILTMEEIFEYQKNFLWPKITFLIEVDIKTATFNLSNRNDNKIGQNLSQEQNSNVFTEPLDYFDNKDTIYKQNLIDKYKKISDMYRDRIVVINGNQTIEEIHKEIVKHLNKFIIPSNNY